jgi:hypothetical protein
MPGPFRTALKYSLREQTRNRLALGLLVIFVPLWYFLLIPRHKLLALAHLR